MFAARTRSGRTRAARTALLCLVLAACGSGSSLEGSVSDLIPLDFDQVQVQIGGDAVAIIYLKALPGGGGNDTVFKVTANTSGLDLSQPLQINLVELVGKAIRGAASRAVSGDDRRTFSDLERGFIRFDDVPAVGNKVSGSFSCTFAQGAGFGAGKTAFGDFSATATEAGQ